MVREVSATLTPPCCHCESPSYVYLNTLCPNLKFLNLSPMEKSVRYEVRSQFANR